MRQRRRSTRLIAIFLGLSLVAAACGDDDDTEATDDTAEDSQEISLEPPPLGDAAPECTGESDGKLVVGGLLPQTGDLSSLGPPEEAAAALAVNEINAAGGVLGQPVEFLPGDSGDADPDVANPTVDAHLAADADAILGAASSGISLNVIDKITGACKIQFSPANTSPQFTDYDDDDLYFRTAPSDILQGQLLADLMVADGVTNAAILARQDSYGEGLLKLTKGPFEEQGGEVVLDQVYDPEAQSFEAEVDAVISEDPEALVMIGFDESSRILNALFEQGFTPDVKKIYLTDGNIGNALGEDFTEPGVLYGVKGTLPAIELTPAFRQQLLGVDPELIDFTYAAETYDAMVIMALAAVAADSDDPAAIAAEINGVTRDGTACTTFADCLALLGGGQDIDYNGPSGPQEFSQPGEPTTASFAVQSYAQGSNTIDDAATVYELRSL